MMWWCDDDDDDAAAAADDDHHDDCKCGATSGLGRTSLLKKLGFCFEDFEVRFWFGSEPVASPEVERRNDATVSTSRTGLETPWGQL